MFLGDTWSNLKINMNFDNILDTKSSKPSVPTINQLASSANNTFTKQTAHFGPPISPVSNNLFDQLNSLSPKSKIIS